MRAFIVRLINICALVLSTALFAREPSIALALPVLALIGTLVEQERRASFQTLSQSDRDLFRQLTDALPSGQDSVQFLKDHDMGDAYERSQLKPLLDFRHYWSTPDHEFANRTLEQKRERFMSALAAFLSRLGKDSQPHQTQRDWYRIVSDEHDAALFNESRDALNHLSCKAYEAYCDLVKTGRKMI